MARNAKNTRMCAACRKHGDKNEFVHICKKKDGSVLISGIGGHAEGRGMYLCQSVVCVENAVKRKAFSRCLRAEVLPEFYEELKDYVKSLNEE